MFRQMGYGFAILGASAGLLSAAPIGFDRPAPQDPVPIVQLQEDSFSAWVARFRGRALAQGITAPTFDAAFTEAQYLPDSIRRDRNQAEFVQPMSEYMGTAASDIRVTNGRSMMDEYDLLLDKIEATYGVDRHIVVAVWGMESNYGQRRGDTPLISTLATLSFDGRRGRFFEQ